jgi:hypothetical protein
MFFYFLLNAMVSGDIFSDRELWGVVILILLLDLPRLAERLPQPSAARNSSD